MSEAPTDELELWSLEADTSRALPLPKRGRVVIGRAPGCELVVEDASISRRHAALAIGDAIEIEDLGSANGTWLHPESAGHLSPAASQGPMSTRPGLVAVTGTQARPLRLGQAFMLGAHLFVVRKRHAGAVPASGQSDAPRATPVLTDPRMKTLYATAERVAASHLSVLILGETGVGKEILAEAVHRASPRADKPLLRLHCASLSATLLESELFGHEQGAFTGAVRAKIGLLQSADGGTVFLDEVGELPLDFQVKLLRVIEDRTLTRVGGLKSVKIDVRFIAATNRDLREEVARGRFREDLLYRLDGVTLVIPPLRERRSEIPALAETFVAEVSRALGLSVPPRLSEEAHASLMQQTWPGNVRELRHLIERAVVLSNGDTILPTDLLPSAGSAPPAPPSFDTTAEVPSPAHPTAPVPAASAGLLRDEIADLERQRIEEALARSDGNQTRAAELLGMSRRTLVSRLRTFGFPRPRKPSSG